MSYLNEFFPSENHETFARRSRQPKPQIKRKTPTVTVTLHTRACFTAARRPPSPTGAKKEPNALLARTGRIKPGH